ncbi:MAG: ABC transporter permease [Bdellovibrionota bacterium]
MSFWLLALRNLGRNRKRNLATGSAIAFGFAGILLLAGYSYRGTNYIRTYTVYVIHTGHLAIFAPNGFEQFPYKPAKFSLTKEAQDKVIAALAAEPEVERFEKQIRGQGLIGNGCVSLPFVAQGFDPAADREMRVHPQVKEWMPKFQYLLSGSGLWAYPESMSPVLLSKGLSLSLGKVKMHGDFPPEGAPITVPDCANPREQAAKDANVQLLSGAWAGNVSAADGEVVGTFTTGVQETDSSSIIAPTSLLQKLFDTDHVTEIAVWLKHPEKIKEVRASLEAKLAGSAEILNWDEERLSPFYRGTVDFLHTLVLAGALVMCAIIALSVLNSATMTILERSQEIGMYRSMGFRRSQVRLLYVQESLWLSIISLAAGTALGLAAIRLINDAEILYHPPGVSGGLTLVLILPWAQTAWTAALILFLVCLATYFAVTNRLRPTPADLLGGTLR